MIDDARATDRRRGLRLVAWLVLVGAVTLGTAKVFWGDPLTTDNLPWFLLVAAGPGVAALGTAWLATDFPRLARHREWLLVLVGTCGGVWAFLALAYTSISS